MKHPPLLFIVLHSRRKSRGRVNAEILFRGQWGATHAQCASRTCTWLLPFLSPYLVIHTSERNICVLCSTCLAKKDPQMQIKTQLHLLNKSHPQHGANVDFCCDQRKPESGQPFGEGQAFHAISDWLVLGKRRANRYCHWAVIDGMAGVGHRPGSQGRRLFTVPWLPSW